MNDTVSSEPHNVHSIELLAPAKNLLCGMEAVNHGADAIYIGASQFGARVAAGNSIEDIEELIQYAHRYRVKIYVTLNTILSDQDLEAVQPLIRRLYEIGTDALIVQDMGLLRLDLPPIPLHASTQMDNRAPQKVKFLQKAGFSRVVLARELSLQEITDIHAQCDIPLEAFVHGAVCVSYSGQCYMSYASCGRSANQGACAQYCRLPYTLVDAQGKIILKDKHLLSLKDMDRSHYLSDMMRAGVTSFKIEGRLKEVEYVKNITAYYRQQIDAILEQDHNYRKSSTGTSVYTFTPDPAKTFQRSRTPYFLQGMRTNMAHWDTPKAIGEKIGTVLRVEQNYIEVQTSMALHNGDGLCGKDTNGTFTGFRANRVENIPGQSSLSRIWLNQMNNPIHLQKSALLYRNMDIEFYNLLKKESASRKIEIDMQFDETPEGFLLTCTDENDISIAYSIPAEKVKAEKPEQARTGLMERLSRLGNTPFKMRQLTLPTSDYFISSGQITLWRQEALKQLAEAEIDSYPHHANGPVRSTNDTTPFPEPGGKLTYLHNVMNSEARRFYQQHAMQTIAPAMEGRKALSQPVTEEGEMLMQCKYCIRWALGGCTKNKRSPQMQQPLNHLDLSRFKEPFYLMRDHRKYQLRFNCRRCEMTVHATDQTLL